MPAAFAFVCLFAADAPAEQFVRAAAPVLAQRCGACHGAKKAEGDLDFAALLKPGAVRREIKMWRHAAELVESGQMPPKGAAPLPPTEQATLLAALKALLRDEAERHAGDPGPVPLRRLSNVEYAWTLRDLTGIAGLDPAREFPGDGAAGEGFANAGAALAMSPTLVERYLEAAKRVAEHATLLPDGFVFAPGTTPRDGTDERLAAIKATHAQFATADGKLPLVRYVAALAERRPADAAGMAKLASERGLSAKYLTLLHAALTTVDGPHANPLLAPFRHRYPTLKPAAASAFAAELDAWSAALARTQNVGHRKPWLVAVDPIVRTLPIQPAVSADGTLTLAAHGRGGVAFRNARLAIPGRNDPVAWTDVPAAAAGFAAWRAELVRHADAALELAADLSADERLELPPATARRGVPLPIAQAWLAALGLAPGQAAPVGTLFKTPIKGAGGYAFIQGWGSPDLPSLLANSSAQEVRVPGKMRPKSVAVHPTPTLHAAVAWRSPFAGTVRVEAAIAHAHIECGNGVAWTLELRRGQRRQRLAAGIAQGRNVAAAGPFPALAVRPGDALVLLVGPRDGNHSCDLTDVELRVAAAAPDGRTWSLAEDVAPDVLQGNPHPDRRGVAAVWSFFAEPIDPAAASRGAPAGSLLAKWLNAASDAERRTLGKALAQLVAVPPTDASPDAVLAKQLRAPGGPLLAGCDWRTPPKPVALPKPTVFRSEPRLEAPEAMRHDLPAEWFAGAVFHAEAVARAGAVQVEANGRAGAPTRALRPGLPILAADDAEAARLRAAGAEFRALFPRGVCYAPVVPTDEVVTLELFHRDDEPLRRLLLDDAEAERLDRLWEELRWVAREPLASSAAFVHLMEYATQDSDPKLFEHHRQPIAAAAAAFRQALKDAEPRQWAALEAFVPKAWRRPVAAAELAGLRRLYERLRGEQLPHEEAFRLTLARVLSAPAFLYKLERAADGAAAQAVGDHELAVRLSYFLWSSCPDAELRALADANRLREPATLAAQARRMLADAKAKRLAEEFGGGWLQLTGFAANDEKSPRHFPAFAALRADLHEEVVRGFEDFFRHDRPVSALLDADAGFVNEALARHYGMTGVAGAAFRRVEGLRALGRGGILGQAAALAKHAGAAQTSPALRGAWVSEALLGEKLPKPPKDVPPLPTEAAAAGRSVRQLAERHVADERCAGCHRRFDAFGFALEGFDAIGRRRAGKLDLAVTTPDGVALDGLDGLRRYLLTTRRADFERQFCRKLLGYALGRGTILSDEPLLDHLRSALAKADGRVSAAVLAIVQSPQFRELRGRAHPRRFE